MATLVRRHPRVLYGLLILAAGCNGAASSETEAEAEVRPVALTEVQVEPPPVAALPKQEDPNAPVKAMVLVVVDEGKTRGITIDQPDKLAQLEAFFPRYREGASGRQNHRWDVVYEVQFRFPDRRTVLLRSDGQWWSGGDGDLRVAGDLAGFIRPLLPTEPLRPADAREQ